MTTEHPSNPSKLFGTAGRAFRVLENEGIDIQDFLQLLIDYPVFRSDVVTQYDTARLAYRVVRETASIEICPGCGTTLSLGESMISSYCSGCLGG